MHPFSRLFRNIQSLGEEEVQELLGPPEDALPLLAGEDLNHRVADALNLHLPTADLQWVHKTNAITGLYSNQAAQFNPHWIQPEFPELHLHNDLIQKLQQYFGPLTINEKRKLQLNFPARFFPKATKYFPLIKGIKNNYPNFALEHFFATANYLWTLWEAGILYLRKNQTTLTFKGKPYSWEHRQLVQHNGQQHKSHLQSRQNSSMVACSGHLLHNHLPSEPVSVSTRNLSNNISDKSQKSTRTGLCSYKQIQTDRLEHLARISCGSKITIGQQGSSPKTSYKSISSNFRNQTWAYNSSRNSGHTTWFSSASNSNKSRSREKAYSSNSTSKRYSPPLNYEKSDFSSPGVRGRITRLDNNGTPPQCLWRSFYNTKPCGSYCIHHIVSSLDDWGPCTVTGDVTIKSPRTPRRITGGVFLVDKNPNNSSESRLVVDFSQFSRGHTRVHWPKFAVPNLQTLANLLSTNLQWLSLDVSAAFYHIPISPAAVPHLLVGSPGLERFATCLSSSTHNGNDSQLQTMHALCTRHVYSSLLLLFKTYGRKLHLLAHPFIMGFRKLPMGVGLSPFLMVQFTSALASMVRRNFPHCVVFAYMDDLVLGARTSEHLTAIYSHICSVFLDLGIHLNVNKTKWWGNHLHFMGYVITSSGVLPQDKHVKKLSRYLRSVPVNQPLDYKICERLTGILNYVAPFTLCGYAALMPLYHAIASRTAFIFSSLYKSWLLSLYEELWPVVRQRGVVCTVFADATPTGWGIATTCQLLSGTFAFPLPIATAELIAACLARCWTGARLLGTDNSVVLSGKLTSFPWLLACVANWILRGTSFCYVPSALNPADLPSRGLLPVLRPLPRLRLHPQTSRISLWAASPPVSPRRPVRVAWSSPVQTCEPWIPP
uniref:Protein P n=1 Tax=Woodchuck hepatitis virus TaxID=35269 RepID=Q918N9_9HEPA|nr:type II mutant polymerase [Woodchuck hepatitis virus]